MAWLQPVYEAYLNAGMKDDAHRVQLASEKKGKRAHEDMKEISARVEVSAAEMEKFLQESPQIVWNWPTRGSRQIYYQGDSGAGLLKGNDEVKRHLSR